MQTNPRRLALCGWMANTAPDLFQDLQGGKRTTLDAFLFLTEGFCLVEGETCDFSCLEGTTEGFLFRDVEEDRPNLLDKPDKEGAFLSAITSACHEYMDLIPEDQAWTALFLVKAQTWYALADYLCAFDIWRTKEEQIMALEDPVPLRKEDFSPRDLETFRTLRRMYPGRMARESRVLACEDLCFVFDPITWRKITPQQRHSLYTTAMEHELAEYAADLYPTDPLPPDGPGSLVNPVFVRLDEEGQLLLD